MLRRPIETTRTTGHLRRRSSGSRDDHPQEEKSKTTLETAGCGTQNRLTALRLCHPPAVPRQTKLLPVRKSPTHPSSAWMCVLREARSADRPRALAIRDKENSKSPHANPAYGAPGSG